MKIINKIKLDKYNDEDKYQEICFGIYLDKENSNYHFAFECAEEVEQYPLEDLLDLYHINCTEFYGQKVEFNNEIKYIVEVETYSDQDEDLLKILSLSTISGKEIVNTNYRNREIIAIKYMMSEFNINNINYRVPILGYRSANYNTLPSFNMHYPEGQYIAILGEGQSNYGKGKPSYTTDMDLTSYDFDGVIIIKGKAILKGTNGKKGIEVMIGLNDKIENIKLVDYA